MVPIGKTRSERKEGIHDATAPRDLKPNSRPKIAWRSRDGFATVQGDLWQFIVGRRFTAAEEVAPRRATAIALDFELVFPPRIGELL